MAVTASGSVRCVSATCQPFGGAQCLHTPSPLSVKAATASAAACVRRTGRPERFSIQPSANSGTALQFYYRWDQFQALPWWHHVAALRVQGGISTGNGRFYLGGVPSQDVVDAIINSTRAGGSWLHGFPEAALSAGVEATVVVRFVVTETGEVTNVTLVRGHPLFNAVVLATVKTWRYRPAVHEGRPVSTFKTVRIPFKAKR